MDVLIEKVIFFLIFIWIVGVKCCWSIYFIWLKIKILIFVFLMLISMLLLFWIRWVNIVFFIKGVIMEVFGFMELVLMIRVIFWFVICIILIFLYRWLMKMEFFCMLFLFRSMDWENFGVCVWIISSVCGWGSGMRIRFVCIR